MIRFARFGSPAPPIPVSNLRGLGSTGKFTIAKTHATSVHSASETLCAAERPHSLFGGGCFCPTLHMCDQCLSPCLKLAMLQPSKLQRRRGREPPRRKDYENSSHKIFKNLLNGPFLKKGLFSRESSGGIWGNGPLRSENGPLRRETPH